MQLQIEDRLQLFKATTAMTPDGKYKHMIFAVPCKKLPDEYGRREVMVEILENHRYIGERGNRYFIEHNYRLSLEEAKQDIIRRALQDSNRHLEQLAVSRRDYLYAKEITRAATEAEDIRGGVEYNSEQNAIELAHELR